MAFPTPEDREFARAMSGEQRLLAALVRQAMRDAPGDADARAWLAGGGSFPAWCTAAEVDAGRLAAAIASRAARGAGDGSQVAPAA